MSGCDEEVLIYSGRAVAGGGTANVLCVHVCVRVRAWVDGGGLEGVPSGLHCDPVLSARSVVKAFRIRPSPLPSPETLVNSPPSSLHPHMHTAPLSRDSSFEPPVRFSRATHRRSLLRQHTLPVHTHVKRHSNIPSARHSLNIARVKRSPHTHITLVLLLDRTQT